MTFNHALNSYLLSRCLHVAITDYPIILGKCLIYQNLDKEKLEKISHLSLWTSHLTPAKSYV